MGRCRLVAFGFVLSLSCSLVQGNEAFDDAAFEQSGERLKAERELVFGEAFAAFLDGDYRSAARGAKPLARKGMADAQHLLGVAFQHGLGVKANGKRAEHWFGLAAEQGHAPAMLAAGEFAFGSEAREPDYAKARLLLEPLTRLDWSFAQRVEDLGAQRSIRSRASYLLGLLLIEGWGGEKAVKEGLRMMDKASSTGDAWASMHLAMAYAEGKWVERDVEASKRFFELSDLQAFDHVRRNLEAARMGSASLMLRERLEKAGKELAETHTRTLVQSQVNLAKSALREGSDDYDPEFASVLLEMASESGNTEGQYLLGYAYSMGIGEGLDYERGAALLEAASEKNWVLADYNFAVLLRKGWGVEQDVERADRLLDRAAESGLYMAQLVLDGDREPQFLRDAEDLELCKEFENTDMRASYALGKRQATGWLVERTGLTSELRDRFREAADAGYARAQHACAEFYYWGWLGKRDYKVALSYFLEATEQGHAQSYFKVGYIYEKGLGVYIDPWTAKRYYELSCDFGDAWAANNLGAIYTDGDLGEANFRKAMEYYLLAVERGHVVACYNIAEAYLKGRGRQVDREKAVEWYTKAADGGDLLAAQTLTDLYGRNQVKGDEDDYVYWVERSAELGDVKAMREVARYYEHGFRVAKNLDRSSYWLNRYMNSVGEGSEKWKSAIVAYVRLLGKEGWHGHDPEMAFELCIRLDFAEARLILGKLHLGTVSMRSNPKKGVGLLKRVYRANREGDGVRSAAAEAAYVLSNCYAEGNAVKQSLRQRIKWMKASAKIGFKQARYEMARYAIEGVGMARDLELGVAEMEQLADNGFSRAVLFLGKMAADGKLERGSGDALWRQIRGMAEDRQPAAVTLARRLGIEFDEPEGEGAGREELSDEEEVDELEEGREESPVWSPSVLG